jgi:hypothetical protein
MVYLVKSLTAQEDIEYQVRALKAYEKALDIKDQEGDDVRTNIENDNKRRDHYYEALGVYKVCSLRECTDS